MCAHPGTRYLKGELTCDKAFTAKGVIDSRDVKNKESTLKTRVVGLFCTKVIHLLVSPHCKGSRRLNWKKKLKYSISSKKYECFEPRSEPLSSHLNV